MVVANNLFATLPSFLPAGTVSIPVFILEDGPSLSEDIATDGWAPLPGTPSSSPFRAHVPDDALLETLRFLVKHKYLVATYLIKTASEIDATAPAVLIIRVYIVPWDLAGSGGKLSLYWRRGKERVILKAAQKGLRKLFTQIRQDRTLWDGNHASGSAPRLFWPKSVDNRTLLELYNDLPSPRPSCMVNNVPGLQAGTRLHIYQTETVSTMIERETATGMMDHPLYLPLRGVEGVNSTSELYLQPATIEVVSDKRHVPIVKGGILCEELGTGKTLMILSLILATLDALPAPEEPIDSLEQRTPTTPLALRHFPDARAAAERAKLPAHPAPKGVPSLVELTLHACRIAPRSNVLRMHRDELDQRGLLAPLRANTPFYLHARTPMQWQSEILKHCRSDALRYLYVKGDDKLPDAPWLASDYDLILMSHTRVAREAQKKGNLDKGPYKPCKCKVISGTRVPFCICSRRPDVSPLRQVRWKRLVVDEGHNATEKRTGYAVFTNALSVERRWIVTGTPTSDLLGLNFGSGSEVLEEDIDAQLIYPADIQDQGDGVISDSKDLSTPSGRVLSQRVWHKSERESFRDLGTMFTDFLGMPPFAHDPHAFTSLVAEPIFDTKGPLPVDVAILTRVMETAMVRHRIKDVEQEVRLPALHSDVVLLDLDPYAVKTYNYMQAVIAINAIDSQRTDQDYLFHPRNVGPLRNTVDNISHVMFLHNADMALADEILRNAKGCVKTAYEREAGPEDIELAKQALFYIQTALQDPIWTALQAHYHAFHRTTGMPPPIFHAWNMLAPAARAACLSTSSPEALVAGPALAELRKGVIAHPLRDVAQMGAGYVREEIVLREIDAVRRTLWKSSTRGKGGDKTATAAVRMLSGVAAAAGPAVPAVKPKDAEQKYTEMLGEHQACVARRKAEAAGQNVGAPKAEGPRTVQLAFLEKSQVKDVRIGNSTSTKLDFILNEVLMHSSEEKFLIFSPSPATLAFVAEGLDVARIEYLQFTGEFKQSVPTTFETSGKYRVILMELKHGARGLNIVSASRVIFCEPVWKADVESQAIKRVHRIGQTREVVVKTLAIRGTSEEVIVSRSRMLKENQQEFAKDITDDRTIRDFIAHPTFLPIPTSTRLQLNIPLLDLDALRPKAPDVTEINIEAEVQQPSQKKRKLVQFAD
ncbi:P-loop containing nucleoside triphosphate hydrolase protein [Epithele typhae]|uniref:P-loop containing nucleoside triphosphate hydrolase protein n=1 Tax=Epithele typhae TaxID=378194 RepID=UPI002007FE12|nr:P-loop containing nucleoside triphosphate hydrolase protein [Epithele typhae]KAH9928494.1 P-loop containing nucleoside triphosphate hydrolase protein [Epithele typhae]